MNLDGEIRDGRHAMTVRVYYEDTDFTCTINIQSLVALRAECAGQLASIQRWRS